MNFLGYLLTLTLGVIGGGAAVYFNGDADEIRQNTTSINQHTKQIEEVEVWRKIKDKKDREQDIRLDDHDDKFKQIEFHNNAQDKQIERIIDNINR